MGALVFTEDSANWLHMKTIRATFLCFWPGFLPEHFVARFPCLSTKYVIEAVERNPDFIIYSVFAEIKSMPSMDLHSVPRIFLTGENVIPDFEYCDFAISFCRHLGNDRRHIRIPNWVQRLHQHGYSPTDLLQQNRPIPQERDRFAAFVFNRQVQKREEFFKALTRVGQVDAPGQSMNNYPAIGPTLRDKILFLSQYRFSVAFENTAMPGYTSEKLVEAFQAGTIPIYWGDPVVSLDFNSRALLNLDDFGSYEELAEAVARIDRDPTSLRAMLAEPVYINDQLPTCADDERILAFFESIFG